ncbi:MAG: hypothetical protein M2R45_03495 [Verrucomicrobia subdivision 3 bacterium]|nr:hypothetical protein [Limisphaerales bacterium]MCS1415891.1 hypothetical protein [Limisphaerales bacterium]
MILRLCLITAIACVVGSLAHGESHNEEETNLSLSAGESVSSSLLSPKSIIELRLFGESSSDHSLVLSGLLLTEPERTAVQKFSPADWQRVFPVRVVSSDGSAIEILPAMSGSYRLLDGGVEFVPRFGFEIGVRYQAEFDSSAMRLRLNRRGAPARPTSGAERDLVWEHCMKRSLVNPSTEVVAVYPSATVLPENLLKFYLHFSAPMTVGMAYRHIHLVREGGTEVVAPFLQLDEELWDQAGQRLTVLIDPGRIKSGLLPREEVGPALEEGKVYRLVIDAEWTDAMGLPLLAPFEKRFRVVIPDDRQPKMSEWKLSVPSAGTRETLVVRFPEPLDHALLRRLLWVSDREDREVEGRITIGDDEMTWILAPVRPWAAGIYALCSENTLEDLAGNSLGRRFEVDSFQSVSRRVERDMLRKAFQIR